MIPKGFKLSTASAAIKHRGVDDMALIYSEVDAVAAATFTTNKVKAAPVRLNQRKIRSGKARAMLVNSGNANACTGPGGMADAKKLVGLTADALGVPERQVYMCSTGVIGVRLPMKRMEPKVKRLAGGLGSADIKQAASAIMTTDSFPKLKSVRIKIGSRVGTVTGIAKGAGMIEPNMATMLAFIMTDIAVEPGALGVALAGAVDSSFNRITIDGDRSTNDTVFAMANGMLGNRPLTKGARDFAKFSRALSALTYELSSMIASDGEGATKLVGIEVRGAKTEAQAKLAAMHLANSLLVKTALYGSDPNWGRIMAALGSCGANVVEEKTDIFFGKVKVVRGGLSTGREREARRVLLKKQVEIKIDLHIGKGVARVLTCDLSEAYVRFNAEYTS